MRFPNMHIADSVTSRILKVAGRVSASREPQVPLPPMPNVAAQGAAIDMAVRTPAAPVPTPAGAEPAMLSASLDGDSAAAEAVTAEILG